MRDQEILKIKRKTMRREQWRRVTGSRQIFEHGCLGGMDGEIGLMRIDAVTPPLVVSSLGQRVTLAAPGYCWLQFAPKGRHWWLTTMFDPAGRLFQHYFDVTDANTLRPDGNSSFDDLFLDVVVCPGMPPVLLDQDECDLALAQGTIDAGQYRRAQQTAQALMTALAVGEPALSDWCRAQYRRLLPALDSPQAIRFVR